MGAVKDGSEPERLKDALKLTCGKNWPRLARCKSSADFTDCWAMRRSKLCAEASRRQSFQVKGGCAPLTAGKPQAVIHKRKRIFEFLMSSFLPKEFFKDR